MLNKIAGYADIPITSHVAVPLETATCLIFTDETINYTAVEPYTLSTTFNASPSISIIVSRKC